MTEKRKTKSIIFVGSGGVGKTTTSAAYGLFLAQQNKKVLVLTIDPSQRLKDTLGLKDDGEIQEIASFGQGKLFGCILNSKKVFDEFILRASKKEENIKKILNNRLYIQLSTSLSGSQEFTSLEKFYQLIQSGLYDYVILDTPPAQHAIDFLTAPERLSNLFNEGVAKWFKNPEGSSGLMKSLFQFGTKRVLKALELLTGSQFMRELSEFFLSLDTWQSQLQARINLVQTLLIHPDNQFYLVTSFDESKFSEALSLMQNLKKGGYHLSKVITNRAYPLWLKDFQGIDLNDPSGKFYLKLNNYYQQQSDQLIQFKKKSSQDILFTLVPEFDQSLDRLQDLQLVLPYFSDRENLSLSP